MNEIGEISCIIQARMGSTRLPNKMQLPFFGEKTILDIVIEKILKRVDKKQIILATTVNPKDNILQEVALKHNISFFRGDENNVLKRFIDCASLYEVNHIIRICADNPFIDLDLLASMIQNVDIPQTDYCAYKVKDTPSIKTHFGFFAEYVTLKALKSARAKTEDAQYLEHVTNFIYTNHSDFSIQWLKTPDIIENNIGIRLTIDTKEDFDISKLIYKKLINDDRLNYESIINYINFNPEIRERMLTQIKENGK